MSVFTSSDPNPGQLYGPGGFSAEVKMELKVGERILAIGQMGPDFLILRDPANSPPGKARISLRIDDALEEWEVFLPDGIRVSSREVRIQPLVSRGQLGKSDLELVRPRPDF